MANPPSEVIDTSKPSSDLSLRRSTANRLDYLYEISHVPEDSKIPITDFPIVNPYTVFDKPQVSFKKSIKKLLYNNILQFVVSCFIPHFSCYLLFSYMLIVIHLINQFP